jgi:glycosyltransferase involved in cell wall biosynthesis
MSDDDVVENTRVMHTEPPMSRLETENARLSAERDSLAQALAHLQAQDRELRRELEFSRGQLGEVLGSTVWRFGWPLRLLQSLVRGIRARTKGRIFKEALTWCHRALEPRLEDALGDLTHYPTSRAFGVLFLNGVAAENNSVRYRIHHVREALATSNVRSEVTTEAELAQDSGLLLSYDLLVIFRACWTADLAQIVRRCNRCGIPVIWDSDDYIFEPTIVNDQWIDALRKLTPAEADLYVKGVQGYRKSLLAADYFTGATDFLAKRAEELGKPSYVIRNFLNDRLIEASIRARALMDDRRAEGTVRMVFMSGTPTHQRDFGCIAPVIARVLKERPKARLKIVGHLDLTEFSCLEDVADQITKHDAVPWEDLPELVGDCDICVAPLDTQSPFCQAKSDLKFFEGAAYGLAVVASATEPYKQHIDHGSTGFICETADEWYQVLLRLIDHEDIREATTRSGVREVLENRAVKACSRESVAVYHKVIHDFRKRTGVSDRSLVIRWVVPPVELGSGGHEAVFVAANQMSIRGHLVTLHFLEGERFRRRDPLPVIRAQLGYDPLFQAVVGTDQIRSCDSLIATQNTTAGIVDRFKKSCFLPAYFIQDFEPHFYPIGSEYFAAEQTYHYDFFCIALGQWLADLMRVKYCRRASQVDFWIDRTSYHPGNQPLQERNCLRVAFFVRPNMPRRCFALGVSTLFHLHRMIPEAEILLFGAQEIPRLRLDFPHRFLGVLTKAQLGELYRTVGVGLAFSTTNPSLVPLEMMACGLPVVDLDVLDSSVRHGTDYPALLAPPDPLSLAEALEALLMNGSMRADLSRRGVEFTSRFPSKEEALKQVAISIEREIGLELS